MPTSDSYLRLAPAGDPVTLVAPPESTARLIFRTPKPGILEALEGFVDPMELHRGVCGVVYVVPSGCRLLPLVSAGKPRHVSLWAALLYPSFEAHFDVHNPSQQPLDLSGLRLIVQCQADEWKRCPTCSGTYRL
jgi:hypothetical protein